MNEGCIVDFPPTFPQAVENCVEKAEFYTGLWKILCGTIQNSIKTRKNGKFGRFSRPKGLWRCGKPKTLPVQNFCFPKILHNCLWKLHPAFPPKQGRKISTTTSIAARREPTASQTPDSMQTRRSSPPDST